MDSDLSPKSASNNAPRIEELMQLGIQAARQGNRQNARMIFQQVLATDKQNERAWLWMAAVAETQADRINYLKTVLKINPNNTRANRELNQLRKKRATSNSQALTYGLIGLGIVLVLVILVVVVLVVL